ncbi:MAG: DUF1553 domain-containing protein [Bacteroidetes bacterium]|nr:DUF1553 domain-containing protein [Fibrella sp.]
MKPNHLVLGGLLAIMALSSFSLLGVFGHRVDFNAEVKPILNKNCIACHGGVKKAADFSLLFKHEALAPAESGKLAIVPGDADASEMIRRLSLTDPDERMPLDHPALSEKDIETLRTWINQGAEWGDHWAYQTPVQPEVPAIGTFWGRLGLSADPELSWARNEIDHFVLQKLHEQQLTPSPQANKATLLRRVSLDLTGLPPTETEVADFLRDQSPTAYETVVDRLLKSPGYGEKWAGMWLDLARYADTKGYERDPGRSIWRYRDWLIRAFNDDKPYDQFLTEQLAGDLLPNRNENTLIATGFHRNTMTNDEGGTQDEEFRMAAVMDRVSTTWDVFQGTTFACVQCHSHPYDPFVHEDYYRYLAFFNNTRDEDVTTETPTLRFYKGDDSLRVSQLKNWISAHTPAPQRAQKTQTFNTFLNVMEPKINSHDFDQHVNASLLDAKFFGMQHDGSARIKNIDLTGKQQLVVAIGTKETGAVVSLHRDAPTGPVLLTLPVPKRSSEWNDTILVAHLPAVAGRHHLYLTLANPTQPKNWVMIKWVAFQESLPAATPDIEQQYATLLNVRPKTTPVMWEGTGDLARPTHVFERGNMAVKGKRVTPGVPKSLPPMAPDAPRNRLGLANWMTSPDHPLTARVAVNRFWEQLFGTGIVETVEDMGTQGIQPTHRELLDWLAVDFQQTHHWSMKQLLKTMVMSATYRQRSDVTPALLAQDPVNTWLARGPRVRLSAEQVRDQALAVSGLISPKMYGPSVMPVQPDGIWGSPYDGASWVLSQGEDRYRRALYTYWKRTSPYPSMLSFDSPSREFCQIRRIRTNTPLQALVTLNDPVYVEAAQQLACYMLEGGQTPAQQIQAGFRRVMGRDLSPGKLTVLIRLYRTTETHYRQQPAEARQLLARADATATQAALTVTANTLLNLDEVITKE